MGQAEPIVTHGVQWQTVLHVACGAVPHAAFRLKIVPYSRDSCCTWRAVPYGRDLCCTWRAVPYCTWLVPYTMRGLQTLPDTVPYGRDLCCTWHAVPYHALLAPDHALRVPYHTLCVPDYALLVPDACEPLLPQSSHTSAHGHRTNKHLLAHKRTWASHKQAPARTQAHMGIAQTSICTHTNTHLRAAHEKERVHTRT